MENLELLRRMRRKNDYKIDYDSSALIVVDMQEYQTRESNLIKVYRNVKEDLPNWYLNTLQKTVEPNIEKILNTFRENNGSVIFTKYCTSTHDNSDLPRFLQIGNQVQHADEYIIPPLSAPESDIIKKLAPLPNEDILVKAACGAFEGTNLEKILRNRGIKTVVIVGVITHMCIDNTARSAFDKGFDVLVIDDACGALEPSLHESTLASLELLFSKVCKTWQIVPV